LVSLVVAIFIYTFGKWSYKGLHNDMS